MLAPRCNRPRLVALPIILCTLIVFSACAVTPEQLAETLGALQLRPADSAADDFEADVTEADVAEADVAEADVTEADITEADDTAAADSETAAQTETGPDDATAQDESNASGQESASAPIATVPITTVPIATVLADSLRVRAGPGADFEVVAGLRLGTEVEVLESDASGEWLRIAMADVEGPTWVAAAFLQLPELAAQAEPTTTDETSEPAQEITSTPVAAEESQPALVPTATPQEQEEEEEDEDVLIILVPTPTAQVEPTVPTAITQPERMNVRRGPGTLYGIATVVDAGSRLEILGISPDGAWYQVSVPDLDEPAWVFIDLTTPAGPLEIVPVVPEEEIPEAPEAPISAVQAATVNAPPPAGGGSFGYGVQAHMLGGGINEAVNATANLGFNWIKQQVEWRVFEGSQGAVDFSELRRIVDAAGGRGISVLFSVVNAPDWAREAGFDAGVGGPPADPGTYAAFVGRMAGEFCGSSLRAIEVWNEQNLHYEWGNRALNPAEYVNLLRAAYGSIKASCPSMLVISGALTPAGDAGNLARDDFAYLEGMYRNGLAAVADGIGVHPSGFNVPPWARWQDACTIVQQTGNFFNGACDTPHHSWSFLSTLEGYRNIMVVYGDANKRLWPTEFGWAVGPAVNGAYAYANDNSPDEQAAWTVEAFNIMRNSGYVGPAFLWNLNFRVIADGTEKAQWGIVRNDYSPMPIYSALQAMAK